MRKNFSSSKLFVNSRYQFFCSVNITVSSVTAVGLSKYNVTSLWFDLFGMTVTFGVTHPEMKYNGTHSTNATLNGESLRGNGTFNVTVTSEWKSFKWKSIFFTFSNWQIFTWKAQLRSPCYRASKFILIE